MQEKKSTNTARNAILLIVIVYATMVMFGMVESIKSVSYPLIKAEFGAAYDDQGGLVSITWFGYVIFCLVASLFMQKFGIKKSLMAGYVLIGLGIGFVMIAPTFWTASFSLLIINAGFGFFEVGTNALGTVVFEKRAALMMNLLHFFYGFGAIIGPKSAGILTVSLGYSWREVYLFVLIPVFIIFIIIMTTKFQGAADKADAAHSKAKITFFGALKDPVVWLFALTLGFMEVIEFGAANWGGLYLKDVYGLDPRIAGASFVSLFYILFTLSRLFGGWAIEKAGYYKSLMISAIASAALFFIGFVLGRAGIWVLPVTGLTIAVMWPTIMAVAMGHFKENAPIVTGAIITVSGAVNGIFQLVVGLTNHYLGESWGYRSNFLYAIIVIIFLIALGKRIKKT